MRPKICVPIVASLRDRIVKEAADVSRLPVQMAEWRVDFYAGYARETASIVREIKEVLGDKELIVTLRTEYEGGEPNGSRFDILACWRSYWIREKRIMWMRRSAGIPCG